MVSHDVGEMSQTEGSEAPPKTSKNVIKSQNFFKKCDFVDLRTIPNDNQIIFWELPGEWFSFERRYSNVFL